MPNLALSIPLPISFLLPIFPFLGSGIPLRLSETFLLSLFLISPLAFLILDLLLLSLNIGFFLSQLLPNFLTASSSSVGFEGILRVGLGAPLMFGCGVFFTYLRPTNCADAFLYGIEVDELANNVFGFLVDSRALEGAIDQGSGFGTVEREELLGVLFDFL